MTAPVSAGLVRVRIASSRAVGSWSGRLIRSQYLRDGLERVVGRVVPGEARLQLLQHRSGAPAGEDVAGQAQHRQPVHRGGGRAGDHVRRAGTDRACCRPARRGGSSSWRSRWPCGPCPARCGPGRAGSPCGTAAVPGRRRRRCRDRRCRWRRRRTAGRHRRARPAERRGIERRPGRRSGGWCLRGLDTMEFLPLRRSGAVSWGSGGSGAAGRRSRSPTRRPGSP